MFFDLEAVRLFNSLLTLFPAAVFAFTFRGFFRALVATWQGDFTPKSLGFLSLNPAVHLDMLTSIFFISAITIIHFFIPDTSLALITVIIFIILFGSQWTRPVPVNIMNLTGGRKSALLVHLAGAFGNFILALLFLYIFNASGHAMLYFSGGPTPSRLWVEMATTMQEISYSTVSFSVFLAMLELLPIPPLDGYFIFELFAPNKARRWQELLGPFAPMLIFLVILGPFGIALPFQILVAASIKLLSLLVFI